MKEFRRQQRPKKSSLIIGKIAIMEAMKSGIQLDRIYMDNRKRARDIEDLSALAENKGVPINKVPEVKLNSFNAGAHDGFIATKSRVQYYELDDIISQLTGKGETALFLILDGITDIRNIGGIARTGLCCGVHAIIIPEKGVGALNEEAILTSAGALEQIPICRTKSLMKAVDELHLYGIKVFASDLKSSRNIQDCDMAGPCAIVMGNEEKGIFPALLSICDEKIRIPMQGEFDSLNVSVAAGIILYEAMRQRMA